MHDARKDRLMVAPRGLSLSNTVILSGGLTLTNTVILSGGLNFLSTVILSERSESKDLRLFLERVSKIRVVSGHDFSRPENVRKMRGLAGCGKSPLGRRFVTGHDFSRAASC
jgi:hypothetical protein